MIAFLICCVCEVAWVFGYGLLLNSFLTKGIFFFIAFGIAFCLNMIFYKKLPYKDKVNRILWILICALVLAILSSLIYGGINRMSGEFVAEYEVEAIDCNHRNGGKAYFNDRNGRYSSVELHDYRIVIPDDDYVKEGDIICVREYVGFFGETFFVLVEQ